MLGSRAVGRLLQATGRDASTKFVCRARHTLSGALRPAVDRQTKSSDTVSAYVTLYGRRKQHQVQSRSWYSSEPPKPPPEVPKPDGDKKVPRGFERFYQKEGQAPKSEESPGQHATDKATATKRPRKKRAPESEKGKVEPPPITEELHLFPGLLLLGGLMLLSYTQERAQEKTREISWNDFFASMMLKGEVQKLEVHPMDERVYIYLQPGAIVNGKPAPANANQEGHRFFFTISSLEAFEHKMEEVQSAMGLSPADYIPTVYRHDSGLESELVGLLPVLAMVGIMMWFNRGSGASSLGSAMGKMGQGQANNPFAFGKANPTIITKETPVQISFADVAGMNEAKQEVMEFVTFLKNPSKFTDLGARIPKGALLVGPPGTGKTLLAKAVAGEAGVPFFSMSGSDFVEVFVGVGPSRVRDLFAQARAKAPSIIYLDEIDAVGRARDSGSMGGNSERENTLNQLLVEMDGFNTIQGVIMLASTNRPDILDKALLRPGRFDRQIEVALPDLTDRKSIFQLHMDNLNLEDPTMTEELASRLAALTPGFSGADISNACNEAALHAARVARSSITKEDFDFALDRIIGGLEKTTKVMSAEEKEMVAVIEAGRAVASWFLEHTETLLKISIVPRSKNILGHTQKMPLDKKLYSTEMILDRMCVLLGGRVAEQLLLKKLSTGTQQDLDRATRIAYQQVAKFGMSKTIGQVSLDVPEPGEMKMRPYSDRLQQTIDREVRQIVDGAMERTRLILTEHTDQLKQLAQTLQQKEVVTYEDLQQILGPSPFFRESPYHLANANANSSENKAAASQEHL